MTARGRSNARHASGRHSGRHSGRRRGFTVIELLIAVSIVIFLVAILVMGLAGTKDKAYGKASKALIEQLKVAMQSYHAQFRDYPPDGYDQEPNWTYDAQGVRVGSPTRSVKGTAALVYFLCRPVTKVTISGEIATNPDGSAAPIDERYVQRQKVGPFLVDVNSGNFSREAFEPNRSWNDSAYWDENRVVEIIDTWGRPLCYDKVKVDTDVYFQPNRFHNSGATGALPRGTGFGVHSDQELFTNGLVLCTDDTENSDLYPGIEAMDAPARYLKHMDPRFIEGQVIPDPTGSWSGTRTSHEPKNVGSFDLWSYGRSYMHAGDDITSWE